MDIKVENKGKEEADRKVFLIVGGGERGGGGRRGF